MRFLKRFYERKKKKKKTIYYISIDNLKLEISIYTHHISVLTCAVEKWFLSEYYST